MNSLLRRLKTRWRKIARPVRVVLDGIAIDTSLAGIPKLVRSALYKENYEDAERVLISRALAPGMTVVEIGTGIGFISLFATRICGAGKVFSYEANPFLQPIIRRNFEINNLVPNLTMKAVTLDGQPISFFHSENIVSSSLFDRQRDDEKITVESIALSQVLDLHDPDVIVMDVEGAEIDLLGKTDLRNVRHIIVEVHPHIVGEAAVAGMLEALREHGFVQKEKLSKTVYLSRSA